jgi:carbon monoxide dehydrogenase subunit G
MWFNMQPSDLDFAAKAPDRISGSAHCPAPPHKVFAVLADASTWPLWFDDMRSTAWTTSSTSGVGAVRKATLGLGTFEERMIAWEPGARFSFSIDGASVPLARRVVEDWRLSAEGDGTRLDWTMSAELGFPVKLARPILVAMMERMFRRTSAGLDKYLQRAA